MGSLQKRRIGAGQLELSAWKDFLEAADRAVVDVDLSPEGAAEDAATTEAQLATVRYVEGIQAELRTVVEAALRKYYDSARPKYAAFAEAHPGFFADFANEMPVNPEPAAFARLHTLQGVFIHPVVLHKRAYVGFSFRASWETEHGVGVLVHDRRVVQVGGADVAFTQWIAEQDRDDAGHSSPDGAG